MTEITKKVIQVTREVLVKPARLEDRDTGKKKIIQTIDKQGKQQEEQIPVLERVQIEAEYKQVKEDKFLWCYDDGTDVHEFANETDAKEFRKTLKR